jgi:hypothetical protein
MYMRDPRIELGSFPWKGNIMTTRPIALVVSFLLVTRGEARTHD